MTESASTTPTKVPAGISVGGMSTVIIIAFNQWGNPDDAATMAAIVPILVGGLFWGLELLFAKLGWWRPLHETKIISAFNKDIKELEEQISKAKSLGYQKEDISELVKQHKKLVIAKSEISSGQTKNQLA
ncbi:hypothetical protein [Vibrio cyclitrophicus]|uniref:hypothetical protein n=1 Tax=Vibrio cyclitrophicus TaxID=47951 RepID=UPI000C84EA49|nr:hypothetical protein [Vibrio cyclitrophicus]PMH73174.1 hypothetical protein BCU59_07165 [Vibrio cyclitrophicus]